MKYEIDLPGVDDLTDKIVESMSNELLHGGERSYNDGIRDKIEGAVIDRLHAKIDAEVESIVNAHLAATFQPTNELGEPIGEPLTLRSRISKHVKAWCEEKVDRDGNVKKADSYYDKDRRTRSEWAVARAVEEIAGKLLSSEVSKASNELKAQINGKVTEATASVVKRLLSLP